MIRLARTVLLTIFVGAVAFWLVRFGFWMDAVFTQRTPAYWVMSKVVAWAVAVILGGMAGVSAWKAR